MGASFCCMQPSQAQNPTPKPSSSTILVIESPEKVTIRTRSTRVYKDDEEGEGGGGGKKVSLKEWLVKSPNNNVIDQHHAIKNRNHEVMRSPDVRNMEFYTPRISFSAENRLGMLEKVDEDEDEEGSSFTPILKRNESQKLKKKTVSFRFPQEADIFIFYSPRESFEDN